MRLIHRAGDCDNGPCPNVFDTDLDGVSAVQGERLTDAAALAQLERMPAHETVVLVPQALLLAYAKELGWQPPA